MRYFVLGANGFIGSYITTTLRNAGLPVVPLTSDLFDLTNGEDYKKFDFSNTTIIDCIAAIDEGEDTVNRINVDGVNSFIHYLNEQKYEYNYVYFSTASAEDAEMIQKSHYVASKYKAEALIRQYVKNYKIIRLVFPFGPGERNTRLISRLIEKIKHKQPLTLDNVVLNLTPIEYITTNIIPILQSAVKEVTLTDGKIYMLKEVVDCLYKLMKLPVNYTYNNKKIVKHTYISDFSAEPLQENLEYYLRKMVAAHG